MESASLWGEGHGGEMEDASSQGEGYEQMDLIPSLAAMAIMENVPPQITAETLREMDDRVKCLVEQGRVFAVQQHQGGRRFARITITADKKLYLHHLRAEPPPFNACLLEHSDVMRLVDPSSRLTFLELGVGGSSLGRIHIRLTPDTQAAKQFSFLCTGELGPSYANTCLLNVWERGLEKEYVTCGDYERNNGSGGKAIVSGLGDREQYNQLWNAGTVWGFLLWNEVAAQFCILTKDNPDLVVCSPSFGMVEEGLYILKEAIRCYSNIRNVFVMNCGGSSNKFAVPITDVNCLWFQKN